VFNRLIAGLAALALGAVLLASADHPGDRLDILLTVIGWLAAIKGLFFLVMPAHALDFYRPLLAKGTRIWALAALIFGLALIAAAVSRLS